MEEELLNELRSRALEADPELLQFVRVALHSALIYLQELQNYSRRYRQ